MSAAVLSHATLKRNFQPYAVVEGIVLQERLQHFVHDRYFFQRINQNLLHQQTKRSAFIKWNAQMTNQRNNLKP